MYDIHFVAIKIYDLTSLDLSIQLFCFFSSCFRDDLISLQQWMVFRLLNSTLMSTNQGSPKVLIMVWQGISNDLSTVNHRYIFCEVFLEYGRETLLLNMGFTNFDDNVNLVTVKAFCIPLQQSWKGGILVSHHPSVCLSVCLCVDIIMSALYLPQY